MLAHYKVEAAFTDRRVRLNVLRDRNSIGIGIVYSAGAGSTCWGRNGAVSIVKVR